MGDSEAGNCCKSALITCWGGSRSAKVAKGDIAHWIKEAAGFTGEIVYNNNKFVGVRKRMLDVTRVRDVLGWTAATSIRDGLKKTVEWYNADLDRSRAADPA